MYITRLYAGATAPNPLIDRVWFDLSENPSFGSLKFYSNGKWQKVNADNSDITHTMVDSNCIICDGNNQNEEVCDINEIENNSYIEKAHTNVTLDEELSDNEVLSTEYDSDNDTIDLGGIITQIPNEQ